MLSGGVPGNKGGGRPANVFRRRLQDLVGSDEALEYLKRCILGEEGPRIALQAAKYAAEFGFGKPRHEFDAQVDPPVDLPALRTMLLERINGAASEAKQRPDGFSRPSEQIAASPFVEGG